MMLLLARVAFGDTLEVFTAAAHLKDQPVGDATTVVRLVRGDVVEVLDDRATRNGYYHARMEDGRSGWVYRALVRGHVGPPPWQPPAPLAPPGLDPSAVGDQRFWFGNMHSHVKEGSREGNIPPSTHVEAFRYAREEAGLDFLAVTPHNHLVAAGTYGDLLRTSTDPAFYVPGAFVPIPGQEFSSISGGNHLNVFEASAWIDPDDVSNGRFDQLYDTFLPLRATDLTFAQFNHPETSRFKGQGGKEYGRDDYAGFDRWVDASARYVSLIEVVKAPTHEGGADRPHYDEDPTGVDAWLWAVQNGWRLAPTANQDNHRPNWGTASDSRTVAIAPELTREALAAAFQARRVYATEDSTLQIVLRAGDHWMGSVVPAGEGDGLRFAAFDPEEPTARYRVRLFRGTVRARGEPERTEDLLTIRSEPWWEQTVDGGAEVRIGLDPSDGTFVFARVTQTLTADDPNQTEDDAWTAPIWFTGEVH